jgi:hypothetical protein
VFSPAAVVEVAASAAGAVNSAQATPAAMA